MKKILILFSFLFSQVLFANVFYDLNLKLTLPDNSPVRRNKIYYFNRANYEIKDRNEVVKNILLPFDVTFQVVLRKDLGEVKFLFINEINKNADFNLVSPGSYIITKSLVNGSILSIQVYLSRDPNIYAMIRPGKDDFSYLDIYVFDKVSPLQKGIRIPYSIEDAVYEDFNKIIDFTRYIGYWNYTYDSSVSFLYEPIIEAAKMVHNHIKDIPYSKNSDGVTDEHGNIVSYSSKAPLEFLGEFGVSKWIVESFYKNTDKYISLSDMDIDMTSYRAENSSLGIERENKVYRALDFARALSFVYNTGKVSEKLNPLSFDVKDIDFFYYRENVGYNASELKKIFYFLTLEEPWTIHLISMSKPIATQNSFLEHYKIVTVFSWIDSQGYFKSLVIDGNKEFTLDSFILQHLGEFAHINTINVSDEKFIFKEFKK